MKMGNLPSNTAQITFVFFDVGGVAIIDFSGNNGWHLLRKHWGINEANQEIFDTIMREHKNRICVDAGVVNDLRNDLLTIPGFQRPNGFDWVQDFVDRFDKNESIWPIFSHLSKLGIGYGLLTDMYPTMMKKIMEKGLLPMANFNPIIDSSMEGCQKNNLKIFSLAQERIPAEKSHVLFVDNSPEKIMWGRTFGWQTFLYNAQDPVSSSKALESLLFG